MRFLAATLLILSGCSRPPALPPPANRPELALDGVTLRVYRNSDPQLFAKAARVELMRSTNEVTASTVHFDFLTDGAALEAPRLNGNLSTEIFDVTGGITLTSTGGGWVGQTEAAHFEGREGEHGVASGQRPVVLRGLTEDRKIALTADKFRFDVAQQHATFEPVRTRVEPK